MRREPAGRQNGAAIRALRKKDKRSTTDLAAHVGMHPQALRNIENNSVAAGAETIKRIADTLGVPVEAITRDGTDPLPDPELIAAILAACSATGIPAGSAAGTGAAA